MIRKIVNLLAGFFAFAGMLVPVLGMPDAMQNIKSGNWGGQGINLTVENDSATVEYDCANGTISGPLRMDSEGKFALSGRLVREHGGPVRENVRPAAAVVSYTGRIDGDNMTLRVTLTDSKEVVGDYELAYGRTGRLRKCK